MDVLSLEERKEIENTMRETLGHLLSGNLTIGQVVNAFGDSVNNSVEIAVQLQKENEQLKIQSNKYAKRLCQLGENDNIIWFPSKNSIFNIKESK